MKYLIFFLMLSCNINLFSQVSVFPESYSLEKYSGDWNEQTASCLLRRALFGPRYDQIKSLAGQDVDRAVDGLFIDNGFKDSPRVIDSRESIALPGQDWVTSVYPNVNKNDTHNARVKSLRSWLAYELISPSNSIGQKMFMFWVNHFGSRDESGDARIMYSYYKLLRESSLGNFKELVKKITIHPHMLCFLNGKDNRGSNPNDNYAREFLELFSIGKSDQIDDDDFSNYTEQDILAGSRIFSGWVVDGIRSSTVSVPSSRFVPARHSNDIKQLSHHYGNIQISTGGENEYLEYIDVVFDHPDIGLFISAELYRFFVGYVTPEIEEYILPQMNQILKSSNFEIEPVLKALLKSQHFYDTSLRGSLVKGPLDFVASVYQTTDILKNKSFIDSYAVCDFLYKFMLKNGQDLLGPPQVAGWEAYYLEPHYSRLWMNGFYYNERVLFVKKYLARQDIEIGGQVLDFDLVDLLEQFEDPSNSVSVIDNLALLIFPTEIGEENRLVLKKILTATLPDIEWTLEYFLYQEDLDNKDQRMLLNARLRAVVAKALIMNYGLIF